jgi:hypothetical protein
MRFAIPVSTVLVLCLTLAGVGAGAAAASQAAPVNACKVLTTAVHAEPYWSVHLTKHSFVPAAGGGWRCELTSEPPKGSVTAAYALALMFFASRTPALAHTNVALLAGKGPALRGTGADEAFAKETHEGGATSTRVTWRKGRYWGWLSVEGPKLAGDADDARDLLRGFTSRLSRG